MRLAIIGAMSVEIELLKDEICDLKVEKHGSFVFYSGKIAETPVIVLLCGIGKVAAAVGTTLLIERYNPDFIINTGTAGGLQLVKTGELVIGTKVAYHDADLTAFGYTLGQMVEQPLYFLADESSIAQISKSIKQLPYKQKTYQGVILSGDSFMSDSKRVKQVKENFPKALAVDMESAAIGQACRQLNIPFVILRVVSDPAGEGDSKSYDTFVKKAGHMSAQIVINYIKKTKWKK